MSKRRKNYRRYYRKKNNYFQIRKEWEKSRNKKEKEQKMKEYIHQESEKDISTVISQITYIHL